MNNKARNWIIGIVLSATAAFVGMQTANSSVWESAVSITSTPSLAYEGCAYVSAYQDAPEVTEKLDLAIKGLNPEASAKATLFGENCILADGTSTFGVRETDITVKLPVQDLSTHEEFGNWIKIVMQIVTEIPREEIQGNYGFVEFWFEKAEFENIVFRVLIQDYLNNDTQKSGIELFNTYYIP